MTSLRHPCVLMALLCVPLAGQDPSGVPGAYMAHTPARISGVLTVDFGHPSFPNHGMILSLSDGYGPSVHPLVGTIWLEYGSPLYSNTLFVSDANGNVQLVVPIPAVNALFNADPVFGHCFTAHPSLPAPGWSISKTVRVHWEIADTYNPVPDMSTPRFAHTATSLAADARDDRSRVLVAGGSVSGSIIFPATTDTTELYNPLKRDFEAGPTMGLPRGAHEAVRLADGRVLIIGGITTGGLVTATCEVYDPSTGTIAPTGAMNAPRGVFAATLLFDGRVMVSGGIATWVNAGPNFAANLSTAQDTLEFYDPATGVWSLHPQTMASRRMGHTHTILNDGRVMIASGINGGTVAGLPPIQTGQVPTYTNTCQLYHPATNSLSSTGNLPGAGVGFHGASLLPSGDVVVTGGVYPGGGYGAAVTTDACWRWDGTDWSPAGVLPTAVAFHVQIPSVLNGDAIVNGGVLNLGTLAATATSARNDGSVAYAMSQLGTHPLVPGAAPSPRANHTMTRLYDGSYLVLGGSNAGSTLPGGFTY